jgi:hypothetical protein
MSKLTKIVDQTHLCPDIKIQVEQDKIFGKRRGIDNKPIDDALPTYDDAQSEKVIPGYNNNFIILGRDRPGTTRSGYGGKGATAASRIDLIAGLASSFRHKDGTFGPPCSGTLVNPNFAMDAARVYISQKSDLDRYMGLAEVPGQAPPGRSGIGLKADVIRIHARQDIKIVTGRARVQGAGKDGERLSTGGVNEKTGTISLIAGNYTDADKGFIMSAYDPKKLFGKRKRRQKLQPIPKGDNLAECLEDIIDAIAQLQSQAAQNTGYIREMSAQLMTHIHTGASGPVSTPLVINRRFSGLKPIGPKVFRQAAITSAAGKMLGRNIDSLKLNHLDKLGDNYINSRFVFTT